MAAAHERDDDGGDEHGGAEHDEVVLEPHEHRRDCTTHRDGNEGSGSELTPSRIIDWTVLRAPRQVAIIIKSNNGDRSKTDSMAGGW
jgi:hypothetical protein